MFEWLKTGVLKKNYETDRVKRLIAWIKLDQCELNWIYIQIVEHFTSDDIRMLKKAFGKGDEINCWDLAKEILEYKRRNDA